VKKIKIKIGDLFEKLNISDIDKLVKKDNIFIKTPSGELVEIKGFIKKSPKDIYEYEFSNGIKIKCSDEHLFQEKGITKKARDCEFIDTINESIAKLKSTFLKKDYVFDISIDTPHLYVTPNGVIHHNTSVTNAIIKDLDADVKWINGSQDRGISTFRDEVKDFISSVSIDDSPKIVVIDEGDGLTNDAQKQLRGLIEEFSQHSTFIMTCNYKEKIIEPLRNRLIHFDFDALYNQNKKEIGLQIFNRLQFILNNEQVQFNPKDLTPIVQNMYPSVRKMVLSLQQSVQDGKLEVDENSINAATRYTEILNLIKAKNFGEVRKKLQNIDDPASLYTYVFKHIDEWFKEDSHPTVIIITAKYQDMDSRARDKVINSAAFCVELMMTPNIDFI